MCGGAPEHDPLHVLSAVGYKHDDVHMTCSDCEYRWVCGRPVGEYDGPLAEDLFCASCEERYGLAHHVELLTEDGENATDGNHYVHDDGEAGDIRLHLKCPNTECNRWWTTARTPDEDGVALVGYPEITGTIDDETAPRGYDPKDAT